MRPSGEPDSRPAMACQPFRALLGHNWSFVCAIRGGHHCPTLAYLIPLGQQEGRHIDRYDDVPARCSIGTVYACRVWAVRPYQSGTPV